MTIEPITDPATVEAAMSLIEDLVDKPWHLNIEWLVRHRWAAVPVESASHFSERDAELLSEAAKLLDCHKCLAVATEPLLPEELCYRVPTTQEGLLEFSHEATALNYVLLPEDRSFSVLCTSEDYYLVAGSREFVTKAIGASIDSGREAFLKFADDQLWPEATRRRLIAVAERYAPWDGS